MRSLSFSSLLLSLAMLTGCGGPADDADAGHSDAGAVDASTVDAALPDAGSDAGTEPDAGADASVVDAGASDGGAGASVHWVTVTEPRTIDGDVGLDYAFQYDVTLDDPFAYQLSIETCIQLAGMAEDCRTDDLGMAFAGTRYLRTGIDPSMYAVGENHYRWRVILMHNATVVDDDVLEQVLTVTSCETCVGSSGAP